MRKTLILLQIFVLLLSVGCASTYYSELPSAQPSAYVRSSSPKDKDVATALQTAKDEQTQNLEEYAFTEDQQAYLDNLYYQMALMSANQFVPTFYTSDTRDASQIIADNVDASRRTVNGNHNFINAKTVYVYNDGIIYDVYYNPSHVTSIKLEENEQIINRALGDPSLWLYETLDTVENDKLYTYILVRPYNTNIETELTVFTDKRVYHFRLISTSGTSQVEVVFRYPEKLAGQTYILSKANKAVSLDYSDTATAMAQSLADCNFNYKIKGSASWKPEKVWSDTVRTYIQFPNSFLTNSETPVVYLRHNGEDELVNFTCKGINYIVPIILSTNEVLVLKVEKEEILIGY